MNLFLPFYGICRRKHKRHDLFFLEHPIVLYSDICAVLLVVKTSITWCNCTTVLLLCQRGNLWTLKMPYYTQFKVFVFHALQASKHDYVTTKFLQISRKHHIVPSVMSQGWIFFFALCHTVWEK